MSEASPICRGKNLTFETVLAFVNAMPKQPLPKKEFHSFAEERLKGWTQTHSQIARQLAFYYEANDICYPRFTTTINKIDLFKYMENWAQLYFVPNPYTPSLSGHTPKCIYASLIDMYKNGITSFDEACKGLFDIELNNLDKVKVYLTNFTNLVIDSDIMSINEGLNEVDCSTDEKPSLILSTDTKGYYDYFSVSVLPSKTANKISDAPLQQIFFGAPGTGKSHGVKLETEAWEKKGRVVRTTFHPDSDYSTFVGAYKPTTERVPKFDIYNKQIKIEGEPVTEQIITYEFVPQAFLQAYVAAWTKREEPEYLIIEEINRGNCAQIFGDLFQLLDRADNGFSEYAIKTDKDMQKYLVKELKDTVIEDYPNVKNGTEMVLPSNLFIRATMNTSDQSLFPIDSAFKRRWEWKYIPITDAHKNFRIEADGVLFDWWNFLSKINEKIAEATSSEDKKLGYFFCKSNDGVISAEKFVSKVLFYLYNDVFKDADESSQIFSDENNMRISFDSFYMIDDDGNCVVNDKAVRSLLEKMEIDLIDSYSEDEEVSMDGISDKNKFIINGKIITDKVNHVAWKCIEEYVRMNPTLRAEQVYEIWSKFNKYNLFKKTILLKENLDSLNEKNIKLINEIKCAEGTSVWGYRNGWTHNPAKNNDSLAPFIEAVNKSDLGIGIVEEQI